MTLQECYAAMSGDYEGTLARFRREASVQKFLGKFLYDPSYNNIKTSMAANNQEEAFRGAHTLKGVSQNLGLTQLYESSHELTEALRGGDMQKAETLLPQVDADYQMCADAIRELCGE